MTKSDLIKKRTKLFEKYREDCDALFEKWLPTLEKASGLDGGYEYERERKKLREKFKDDLQKVDIEISNYKD